MDIRGFQVCAPPSIAFGGARADTRGQRREALAVLSGLKRLVICGSGRSSAW